MSFTNGPNIITSGLVLALDAADTNSYPGSGTIWRDMSGNSNNGTLTNGPTFNSGNGGSIVFDGSNDYVGTPYSGSNTSSYTFSVWFNPLNSANTYPLNRGRDISGNGQWSLLLGSDNTSGIRYRVGAVVNLNGYFAYSLNPMTLNQWAHLTGVYINGSSINLYVNGVFNSSTVTPAGALRTSVEGWALGSITTVNFSNQQIASTHIYNRALNATEILQNYNATKTRFGL